MAGISTAIQIHDQISAPLQHMNAALQMTLASFQSMQSAAERPVDVSSPDMAGLAAARSEMEQTEIALQDLETTLKRAALDLAPPEPVKIPLETDTEKAGRQMDEIMRQMAERQWPAIEPIVSFDTTGFERLDQELDTLGYSMREVAQKQADLLNTSNQASFLPDNAKQDIQMVSGHIQDLQERMDQLGQIDVDLLSVDAATGFAEEYEKIRHAMNEVGNLQKEINTSMQDGDLSALNSQYTQLNTMVHAVDETIKQTAGSLQELSSIQWKPIEPVVRFDTSGFERWDQELISLGHSVQEVAEKQAALLESSGNAKFLPDNAKQDIKMVSDHVQDLQARLDQLGQMDVELLSVDAASGFAEEYEKIRRVMQEVGKLQDDINTSMQNGDMSALNVQYGQLNTIIQAVDQNIKQTTQALEEMTDIQWKPVEPVVRFNTEGVERLEQELGALDRSMQTVADQQTKISEQTDRMKFLPEQAQQDIQLVSNRIAALQGEIEQLGQVDTNLLSADAVSGFNQEYEQVRLTMQTVGELQEQINESIANNDIAAMNEQYTQLNGIIQGVEQNVRQATTQMEALTNVEWKTPPSIEVFKNTGVERFQQEVQSANNMMHRLTATQRAIQTQASKTNLFPANMITDLNTMNNRIRAIQQEIVHIQNNPIDDIGAEAANQQVEQLRGQLQEALQAQEDLNTAMDNMDISAANEAYERLSSTIDGTERHIRDNVSQQQEFTREMNEGINSADNLGNKIKGFIGAYAGIQGVRGVGNWISQSLDLTNIQLAAERQLNTVLKNVGAADNALEQLKQTASSIQNQGWYGDEAMLGGAGELSTYINDLEAIESMMGTLANYAAGMSGGGALDYNQMVDYATQLGKALDGTYDGLLKKGFELSDAQKEIIENGSDMEKALVLDDVISQSWANLYDQMSELPEHKIQNAKNALGDVREEVGNRLYPAVVSLWENIGSNMPMIENLFLGFATVVQYVMYGIEQFLNLVAQGAAYIQENWSAIGPVVNGVIGGIVMGIQILVSWMGSIIQAAGAVASFISENWSIIAPIILGIAAALAVYHGWMLAMKAVTMIQEAATWAMATAQSVLNAIMAANPVMLIVLGVIALVAIIYAAVAAFNKFADTSISATGIVCGAFFALGAFIYNIVATIANYFLTLVEFFVNVWTNGGYAVKKLFVSLANLILDFCISATSGFDEVATNMANAFIWAANKAINAVNGLIDLLNKIPGLDIGKVSNINPMTSFTSSLSGMKDSLNNWLGDAPDNYWEAPKFELKNVGESAQNGYDFGKNIADTVSDKISGLSDFGLDFDEIYQNTTYDAVIDYQPDLNIPDYDDVAGNTGKTAGNTGNTAANTAAMKDALEITNEELKYLKDIAERDAINRFTTAELHIDFTANNEIKSDMDIDGIFERFGELLQEQVAGVAEGVHS